MKIDFTKTDGTYSFSDALHLEDDHTFTEAEIEAMKQQRFDNWLAYILAPAVEEVIVDPEAPVVEEVIVEPPVPDTSAPTV